MQFRIKSDVKAEFRFVASHFGKPLFTHLLPKFPPIKLLRFEGCAKGDLVSLTMKLFGYTMEWDSEIIQTASYDRENNFIDQGIKLPFFLIYWEHKHRIIGNLNNTVIIDEIYYKSPNLLLEILMYPLLYLSFFARKKGYRTFFENLL